MRTVLRGREAELDAVSTALTAAENGRGRVLLVEGPSGIGKTALLTQATEMADRAGHRVLAGEALESRRAVPFAPLLAALSSGSAPVLDPDATRQPEGATDTRYWVVHDMQSALESAAALSPVTVAVDDLQWADNATLAAVHSLVAGLVELPVLWLLAVRTGRRRRAVTEVVNRLPPQDTVRVRLGGLPPDAVAAVIGDHVDAPVDATVTTLADRAQGNPFLLVELLRGLRDEGRLRVVGGRTVVTGHRLPRPLTASTAGRLAGLSADAQQLLRVASTLPPRFTAAQLAAVLRLPPSALLGPLEEALQADLLTEAGHQLRFRHDLLRQAVVETMPPSLRRALQRDAVSVLLASGAASMEVALQLAESAEPGDRAAAVVLRDAARSIAGSDAVTAADLSTRALDLLPPDDTDRGMFTAETVTLLHRARRSAEAVELADKALAVLLPPRDEAELRLSLSAMMTRPTPARAEENRRALALPALPPPLRARHLGWLAYNLGVGGETAAATEAAEAALRETQVVPDVEARVMAGLALVSAECARGAYTQALLRIEELRGQRRVRPGTLFAAVLAFHHACTLAVLGRLDDAYVVVVEGITAARQERDVLLLTAWTQFGGMLRLAAGELADARAEAAWSAPRDEELVPDTFTGVTRMAALCHVGSHAGDTASLRAGRAAARRVGADSSPAVRQLATRLLAGTASGPGAAAEGARLLADDPLVPAAPLVPCDYGYQPRVARIARKAGVPDLAERAAAATESVDRQNPGVPLFAGLAAQTRGIVADDPALLVDAAHLLQGTQRPLVAAGAAEDAGRVLGERKDAAAAIVHLQSAFDTYLALGAHADARRVARMLRRQGVDRQVHTARPASGWASLTPSELQVVRLIARGSTNRSAAEQLYLSPHTVSSHLRSAFSKLGIRSRVQLARFLQEVEP